MFRNFKIVVVQDDWVNVGTTERDVLDFDNVCDRHIDGRLK